MTDDLKALSAREVIAEIVSTETNARLVQDEIDILNGHEVADAILAALPGMVKPLVWSNSYGVWRAETPFGEYKVMGRVLTLPLPMNPQQVHNGVDSSKAAAQAHYVAQIMSALGVSNQGEIK